MRRIAPTGLCLAVVSAACFASAAGAATATPEYLVCGKAKKVGKTYTGKYNNKTCTEANAEGKGKYEYVPLTKKAKLKKGTVGHLDIYLYNPKPGEEKVEGHFECEGGTASGTITNSHEGTLALTYKGCKSNGRLVGSCNSVGEKEAGVVVLQPLATTLEWLNSEEDLPGVAIRPATEKGKFALVDCASGVAEVELVGTLTGKVESTPSEKALSYAINASAATGHPEFEGHYSGGSFIADPLLTNVLAPEIDVHSDVPTGQNSTVSLTGASVAIS